MKDTKIKVLTANWCIVDKKNSREEWEGQYIEEKVNTFCKGKTILNIDIKYNPSISTRHLAYITYQE